MNAHDSVLLWHIADAISLAEEFIGDMSYDAFCKDSKTIASVVRQLEIIGEAMGKLSEEFASTQDGFDIQDAVSMRNMLIHEYFAVDEKVVWDTCKENLPPLLEKVKEVLNAE